MDETNGEIVELVCNIDDMTPEALAFASARLLDLGALDVYTVPGTMKKGRPGHVLTVLCRREQEGEMARLVLAPDDHKRPARAAVWEVFPDPRGGRGRDPMGAGSASNGARGFGVTHCKPEYDDVARLAREHGVPFQQVADGRGPQPARRGGGNAMKRACKIVLSLLLVLAVLCGCQSGQQPDAPVRRTGGGGFRGHRPGHQFRAGGRV